MSTCPIICQAIRYMYVHIQPVARCHSLSHAHTACDLVWPTCPSPLFTPDIFFNCRFLKLPPEQQEAILRREE